MCAKIWVLRALKSSPRRNVLKGKPQGSLALSHSPLWGSGGLSWEPRGSSPCLYLLAGKGLLMTNLCPWGTEPRKRCCRWLEGRLWSSTALAGTPSSSSPHSLLHSPQHKLGFWAFVEKLLAFGEEDWTHDPPRALRVYLQPKTIQVSIWFPWEWNI